MKTVTIIKIYWSWEIMNACGLIVEYNPFHNGHLYHARQAKKITNADVLIAVMSGSFLQRGEPAIVDKYHRTKMALNSGIDLVIELPYGYAVQSSNLFAFGSVQSLHQLGVEQLCFGSESGDIQSFLNHYHMLQENKAQYQHTLKEYLTQGLPFPVANKKVLEKIIPANTIDFSKPNNILGFSYIRQILEQELDIQACTIKRIKNDYHDTEITNSITSATSIRTKIIDQKENINKIKETMPFQSTKQLQSYYNKTKTWHHWELYFPYLQYKIGTMTPEELVTIEGIDEGIEYRIKKFTKKAVTFYDLMQKIKTKRYTWTRLQRMFLHILTNTKKEEMKSIKESRSIPYIRLLGMNKNGQLFLNQKKSNLSIPIVSSYQREMHPLLKIEERASYTYYSIIPPQIRRHLFKQEIQGPIILND